MKTSTICQMKKERFIHSFISGFVSVLPLHLFNYNRFKVVLYKINI